MSGYDVDIKSNKFLKLTNGEPIDIRLLNEEPYERFTHGFGPGQTTECQGEDCSKCKEGHDPRQTWTTNVYDWKDSRVKIWTYGVAVARKLKTHAKALSEEEKTLTAVDLRILKEGEAKDTEYTITTRMIAKELPKNLTLFPIDLPF